MIMDSHWNSLRIAVPLCSDMELAKGNCWSLVQSKNPSSWWSPVRILSTYPDSKIHGANMGPTKIHGANMGATWGRQAPCRPHEPCYLCNCSAVQWHRYAIPHHWPFVRESTRHYNEFPPELSPHKCSSVHWYGNVFCNTGPLWGKSTSDRCHESSNKEPVSLSLWMKTWGIKWSVLTGTLKQLSLAVFLTCKKGKAELPTCK